jgi:hypothetical protein
VNRELTRMNTNFFRREVLIATGGFMFGVMAVVIASACWPQPTLGVKLTHAVAGVNYVAVPKPAEVSFQREFGLQSLDSGRSTKPSPSKGFQRGLNLFDLPRQQPWVAPYDFLIQPAQRH